MTPHTTDSSFEGSYPLARRPNVLALPVEILSHIFDLLCASVTECSGRSELNCLIKQLSSVCKAFRIAVLNTVSFWTKIDNDFCLRAGFEKRMVRSRNAPLILDLDLHPGAAWQEVLMQLVPFKDRWKCLEVQFGYDMPCILRAFPSLELPYLETLSATFNVPITEHYSKFLTEWRFPRLTSLSLVDLVPPCGIFHNLTTFKFDSDWITLELEGDNDVLLAKLMNFLSQTPSLQKLHLGVSEVAEPSSRHFPVTELPNLSTISVSHGVQWHVPGEVLSAETLACTIQALKIPNISEFRLHVHFRSRQNITDWISSFAMVPEVLRPVTSLEVRTIFPIGDDTLSQFFMPFPNIQELDLDVPDLASTIQRGSWELKLDHLRSLVVGNEIVDLCRKHPELLNHFSSNPAQIHVTER